MSTFNRATLIGNVGSDPEVRSTTGGGRVATISLATSEKWRDATGNEREETQWHRVVFWNTTARKLADLVERYVQKGARVMVEGKIVYKKWDDKDGNTRYSTEINARDILFLSSKKDAKPEPASVGAPSKPDEMFDIDDDELPF